jgi:hypothetical protein
MHDKSIMENYLISIMLFFGLVILMTGLIILKSKLDRSYRQAIVKQIKSRGYIKCKAEEIS